MYWWYSVKVKRKVLNMLLKITYSGVVSRKLLELYMILYCNVVIHMIITTYFVVILLHVRISTRWKSRWERETQTTIETSSRLFKRENNCDRSISLTLMYKTRQIATPSQYTYTHILFSYLHTYVIECMYQRHDDYR